MAKVVLAYVPVLHRGYLELFKRHPDAETLYLFGEELIREFDHLRKDIRALPPELAQQAMENWQLFKFVRIAHLSTMVLIRTGAYTIVMPDEEESRELAAKYLEGCTVQYENVFLRWDRRRVLAEEEVRCDRTIPFDGLVGEMMQLAIRESAKATNLWRQVGAVIARDGEVLLAGFNCQVPSPHTPYYEGDPRMFFKRNLRFELTTDEHAEARLIAEAARLGIALEGCDIYVTTFPCPPCGKLVGRAGIRRCYFVEGYATLDSERILRDYGVEIIRVQMENPVS